MTIYIRIIFITLCLVASASFASSNWKTSGIEIPEKIIMEIKEKHPSIETDKNLENLLDLISAYYPSAKITPKFNGNTWTIDIQRSLIIASIKVNSITKDMERSIEKSIRSFRGELYSENVLNSIKKTVLKTMKEKGFPNSLIATSIGVDKNRVELSIRVKNGAKCSISGVKLPFRVPSETSLPSPKGEICNISKAIAHADTVEKALKSEGYAFAQVTFSNFIYSENGTKAILEFSGTLGKKIKYEFDLDSKNIVVGPNTFVKIQALTPINYTPYSVKTEILEIFKSKGYTNTTVSSPQILAEGEYDLYKFKVTPGTKTKVTDITILGANLFKNTELMKILRPSGALGLQTEIDTEALEVGISKLRAEYIKRGYWDVKVREPRLTTDPSTGNSTIVLLIEEGLPRVLSNLIIEGNSFITTKEIVRLFPSVSGQPLDKKDLLDFEKELTTKYYESGYIYADIELKISSYKSRKSRPSQITVKINEGPLTKFGEIFIFGLVKTQKEVVEREINFHSGDTYAPAAILESKKKLMSLGIFRSVAIQPMDKLVLSEKGQIIDLSITVKESDAGLISFGPGYDVFKGYNYVIEASHKNISGMARKLSIRGSFSQDKQQEAVKNQQLLGTTLGMGFIEPYLLNLPVDGRLSVSHKAKATNYWKFSTIAQEEVYYPLNEVKNSFVSLYARQKINDEVGSEDQTAFFLSANETQISSYGVKFSLDLRNNISWPTKGTYLEMDAETANYTLDGDVKFNKFDITSNSYANINDTVVFALSLQFSKFYDIDRNDTALGFNTLPTSEALFAGGSELVRGYNRQLGPYLRYFSKDEEGVESIKNEELVGGTTRLIGKIEGRYLVSENSAISIFYDSGNSFMDQSEIEKLEYRLANQTETLNTPTIEDNFIFPVDSIFTNPNKYLESVYTSTGFAYNYLTPLGSFRFGLAFPIKQPTSENCRSDVSFCLDRKPDIAKLDISIAAKF